MPEVSYVYRNGTQNKYSTPVRVALFSAISGARNIGIFLILDKIYHWEIDIGQKVLSLKLVDFLPTHCCKRSSTGWC
jgi:hypothetical protein